MSKMYEEGLVSIIIPTYKRSEKLSRALESILNQTYKKIEVLLVNDNDPNDEYTIDLKKRVEKYYKDDRFYLIMQERHINGAVARNVGIKQAKGEYIAFLDDDDWWVENKIEEQVKVLSALPKEWGGVSCKFTFYDSNEKEIGKSKKYEDGYIYFDILTLMSDVATSTLLLRHEALDNAKYFDENLLRHQDLQLLVDFTYKYKLKEVDQYLHCVDVSDTQNRPDGEKLLQHKKRFFKSIKPILDQLTNSEKKCVYCMHDYEVGYVFLKSGEVIKGIKYCLRIFKSVKAIRLALEKTITKILSVKLVSIYN